jgi:hypothetical protein
MTVFGWLITSPSSCLPKASIHGFWRCTVVFQQGVDTRAKRGHDGVWVANPSPPSCLPKASIHGFGDAPSCSSKAWIPARRAGMTMGVGSLTLSLVMLAEGEHRRLCRRTIVIQQGVDTRAKRGHDGVWVANPSPRHACRRRASPPPPCGEGLGVGVAPISEVSATPTPSAAPPSLPTRGREGLASIHGFGDTPW